MYKTLATSMAWMVRISFNFCLVTTVYTYTVIAQYTTIFATLTVHRTRRAPAAGRRAPGFLELLLSGKSVCVCVCVCGCVCVRPRGYE